MPKIAARSPLPASDVASFFDIQGHLNYRYTMLWRHKTIVDAKMTVDYADAICAFESSLLMCRVFIEFLGLGINYSAGSPLLVEKQNYFSLDGATSDEVKVIDVGGTFVKISDIDDSEKRLLATVFHMAHKATAHLTLGALYMEDAGIVHQCVPVVDRLLRKNLYEVVGETPHQHGR